MKLISLYIENFGCLHRFELEFEAGLTVLQEDNGFGKTTLAEFIRAMFYGFPRGGKTLDKNKRKKYLPWNGGKCGGNLSFEWEGHRFRIERSFGATPKADTFLLLDLQSNQKSDRFTENIGLELFGLDADSFERSTYLPQTHESGSLSTDSIRAKLGDLVEDTNDINNYDKAVTALKNKRSTFVPYRGSGGMVAQARSEVSRLQETLDGMEEKRSALTALGERTAQEEAAQLQAERHLAEVRKQITQAAQAQAVQALRRQYRGFLERQQALQAVEEDRIFENGVPGDEELGKAQQLCQSYLSTMAALDGAEMAPAEREQLRLLEAFFAPGVPEAHMLEALGDEVRNWQMLTLRQESQTLPQSEQEQLKELEGRFAEAMPTEEELERIRIKKERAALLRQMPCPAAPQSGPWKVLGSLALILAVAAVAMLALHIGLGGVILIAAAVLFGATVALVQKGKKASAAYETGRKAQQEAQSLEREVCDFAARWRERPENLSQIASQCTAYRNLCARRDALQKMHEQTRQQIEESRNRLEAALKPYWGTVADFEDAVAELNLKCRQFRDLKIREQAQLRRRTELTDRARALEGELTAFLQPYCHPVDMTRLQSQLSALRMARDGYLARRRDREELQQQMERFRTEHEDALRDGGADQNWDLDDLKQRESELTEELSRHTRQILEQKQTASRMREALDQIPALLDDLERWKEQRDRGQADADTLDATLTFLEQARESLSGSYLGTIQRSFEEYRKRLLGEEKALVTSDLEVCLERQGQTRELSSFSAGQTDLVMLCMRFALVDALFEGTKPFVILDDPFVNLDDAHTAEALKMLRELAQERQILYLVCNSSRV